MHFKSAIIIFEKDKINIYNSGEYYMESKLCIKIESNKSEF